MTTATAPQAPTEDEIRSGILASLNRDPGSVVDGDLRAHLRFVIEAAATSLTFPAQEDTSYWRGEPGPTPDESPWGALDDPLAADMQLLVERARCNAIARCETAIVEELVAAGRRFATDHPDAPRSERWWR